MRQRWRLSDLGPSWLQHPWVHLVCSHYPRSPAGILPRSTRSPAKEKIAQLHAAFNMASPTFAADASAIAAAWQLYVPHQLPARAKPSLLRTHIDTLTQCTDDEAAAMFTISDLSFVDFVASEMKRPGRLMCADQESIIWEMLGYNKEKKKKRMPAQAKVATTTGNSAPASFFFTTAAVAPILSPVASLEEEEEEGETIRIHLHPEVIDQWIQKHGSFSWECSPFEDEKARFAFFWILTALLHNRHNYDLQERSKQAATAASPSPTPSPKSPYDAAPAVISTSTAYSNAARRRYEVEHARRPILFQKDDPTGALRAAFVQQRLALLTQKTLLPHQVREVTWMVSLERMIGRNPANRTSWTTLSTQDCNLVGLPRSYFVHSNARVAELRIDRSAPAPRRVSVAGGALGSETGLGKTISLLALVWMEGEGSALRWVAEDEGPKEGKPVKDKMDVIQEEDTEMEEVKPKTKATAKSRAARSKADTEAAHVASVAAAAQISVTASKAALSKAKKAAAAAAVATAAEMEVDEAESVAESTVSNTVPQRRSVRVVRVPAIPGVTASRAKITKAGAITKKVLKKSKTAATVEGEEDEDDASVAASVAVSVAGSVASKGSAASKSRAKKVVKKQSSDDEVEELDTYIPSSHLQRVKATLLISPNQTFLQHATKARTTLPPSCNIVAVADKAQYLRTTSDDIRNADLVIISTEFFSNAALREAMDYDRELLAESPAKRARRFSKPLTKRALAVKGRWYFHQFDWFRLVLDEAHEVGSPLSAKRSYASTILSISSCFRWYVSATFPHASPDELRFAMQFLQLRVNGQTIGDIEGEYRETTIKEAYVPSMDDIPISSGPTLVPGSRVLLDGSQQIRASPVSYGRASFMLTATAAALRQLVYRDLYFRSTKARVREENPQQNLFQPLRRQVIIARTNGLERLRYHLRDLPQDYNYLLHYGQSVDSFSMNGIHCLFPTSRIWYYGGVTLFFVQKLIQRVVEYLKLLQSTLETNTPNRHLRVLYRRCGHDTSFEFIANRSAADIHRSNALKVDQGIHWTSSRSSPCYNCRKLNCEAEYIDIFPDYTWTAMWLDPVPGANGEDKNLWKSLCSQDFESHRNMDEELASRQTLRQFHNYNHGYNHGWYGLASDVMKSVIKTIESVEGLTAVLRSPYAVTSEQLAKLDSVMKREYTDEAERADMASCVSMVRVDASSIPSEWIQPLQDHFAEAPVALIRLATEYFIGGGEVPPTVLRWAAQQSSLVVATLLEMHRILHEDWDNHRIVLFATHTTDLASLLQWLALLMPQVSVAQGGTNIHSKTKAIQAFEHSPSPSVASPSVAEGMDVDEERKEGDSLAAPSPPTLSNKRKRSDEPLEDVEDEERSVSAASAAAGSRVTASPAVGSSSNPGAAQVIAFTSDHGSSGMDLTQGTHLLCMDRWDQSSAAVREASHRIFKQLEGRVDRLTQATKPIIIRLVQDTPVTFLPFVNSF